MRRLAAIAGIFIAAILAGVLVARAGPEHDTTRDGHVDLRDALDVLSHFGEAYPSPTAAVPAAHQTYVITQALDKDAQQPWRTEDLECNGDDEPVGWSADTTGTNGIATTYPVHLAQVGSDTHAWRFNYATAAGAPYSPIIYLICLSAAHGDLPITHAVFNNAGSTNPFSTPCPGGTSAVGWGQLDRQGSVEGVSDGTTLTGWLFHYSGYQTNYAICLGDSPAYVTAISYVGTCDPGDALTAYLAPPAAPICLDNPPLRTP